MSENIELSYVWDHTIIKILNHDIQSKIGNMIKEWVVFNKLEDFNSLLEYTDDDFTSTVLEGVVATRQTSGQTVGPRVCSYVLVTQEVSLARN